jgi:hypothetical protein
MADLRVSARQEGKSDGMPKHAQASAETETLRVLLDVPGDSAPEGAEAELLAVSAVRDPLEHID